MYCKYCGNQLSDGAIFCPQCGRLLDDALPGQLVAPQAEISTPQPVKKKNPVALVGFILAIAGSALAVISLLIGLGEFMLLFGVVALAGLICSAVGLGLAKSRRSGFGFALAGLITSAVVIIGIVTLFILAVFAVYGLIYFLFMLLLSAA